MPRFPAKLLTLALLLGGQLAFGQAAPQQNASAPVAAAQANTAAANMQASNSAKDTAAREAAVRHQIEDHVRQVVRRYIPDAEFHVEAQIQISPGKLERIPYLPSTDNAEAIAALTPERLVMATDRVELTISLAQRYQGKTRAKLGQIVTRALGLLDERGDLIKFDVLDMQLPPQHSDLEVSLLRSEADLRAERQNMEQLRRERDDLKMQVIASKSEADKLSHTASIEIAKANAVAQKTKDAPTESSGVKHLREFGIPCLFAVIFLVFAILLAHSFGGIGHGLTEAADSMSRAIESSVMNNLAPAGAGLGGADFGDDSTTVPQNAGSARLAQASLDSVQKVLSELQLDLSRRINDQSMPALVRYVAQQLTDQNNTGKAVAAMELLGRDNANNIFQRLGFESQNQVLSFINKGQFSRPKTELMVEAGEEMRTRLLGESLEHTSGKVDQDVVARVMAMGLEELAVVVTKMPDRLAARLLSYLEPTKIANLLTEINRVSPNQVPKIAESMLRFPEIAKDSLLDREVLESLNSLGSTSDEAYKPYLKLYGEILAASEDQVSEAMMTRFMANPQVAGYIRRHAVTFNMFFQIVRDTQEEILQSLATKELAGLYAGLTEDHERNLIESLLPERRRELVVEEAQLLTRRGNRQVQNAHRLARQAVVTRLQRLQQESGLEFASDVDGTQRRPFNAA